MAVPAYCSFDFLLNLFDETAIDFYNPEKYDALHNLQLIRFLFNTSVIVDVDKEKVEEQLSNPNILHLVKSGRLKHESKVFSDLLVNAKKYFKGTKKQSALYLLSNVSNDILSKLQAKSGYYFIGKESDYKNLFIDIKYDSLSNQEFDKELFRQMLTPHHSLVIIDPYVFTEKSIINIKRLLEQIIPREIITSYHLSFIGSSERRGGLNLNKFGIQESMNDILFIANKYLPNVTIEYHIVNEESFHDRYFITNNVVISSGSGLSGLNKHNKITKDNLWHADKPFREIYLNNNHSEFVFNFMDRKLKRIKEWISKSGETISTNPLLNL